MNQRLRLNAYRPTVAEIDLVALKNNVKTLRKLTQGIKFMAVVKADAYGHGSVEAGKAVLQAGADRLGVSFVEEAALLREAGITAPIHVLSAVAPDQAKDIVDYGLIASISSVRFAKELSSAAASSQKTLKVHLKLDTGLHRFGILPEDVLCFCEEVYSSPYLEWEGIFTHLSTADEGVWDIAEKQVDLFKKIVEELKKHGCRFPTKHVGGSTVNIERPDMHFDMVRPGISLFGYCPAPRQERMVKLEQVMSIKTRIIQVRKLPAHTHVGYGGNYCTRSDTRVATLPIGFGDGYSRSLSGKAEALIRGRRCKLAGKVSLDQILVDLEPVPEAEEGDEVVLLGRQGDDMITGREMAAWMNGIPDQVVSTLTARMPRIYLNGSP